MKGGVPHEDVPRRRGRFAWAARALQSHQGPRDGELASQASQPKRIRMRNYVAGDGGLKAVLS